jgi:hypothetical protein
MAGHRQSSTTNRYIHPQIDDARKVLNARFGVNDTPCVDSDQGTKNDTYEIAKDPECLGC